MAVDEKGEGVRRALWGQRYSEEKFYGKGGAKRYTLDEKNKDIVRGRARRRSTSSSGPSA